MAKGKNVVWKLERFGASWPVFWVALLYLTAQVLVIVWPTSWWFEPKEVLVFDSDTKDRVVLEVQREIHRPFNGDWNVVVRKRYDDGWVVACSASGSTDYHPNSRLPDPVTLSWWTDGKCNRLNPGIYKITTTWKVKGSMGLPDKYVSTVSNVFKIIESDK